MKDNRITGIVLMIAALHVAVLSLIFALHHIGYLMTATLSATLIWGSIFFLNEQRHRVSIAAGLVVGLAVQQVAFQIWKAELPGFWWPLAQFGALQFLIAYALRPEQTLEPTIK
jgi:hypothetical protein